MLKIVQPKVVITKNHVMSNMYINPNYELVDENHDVVVCGKLIRMYKKYVNGVEQFGETKYVYNIRDRRVLN